MLPEPLVAIPSHEEVCRIPQASRDHFAQNRQFPCSAEPPSDLDHRITGAENLLSRYQQHCIRRLGIQAMRRIQPPAQFTLDRGKVDALRLIMRHHESHAAITQVA